MSITPQTSSRVPVAAVLVAGLGSQVVDDALTAVLPPAVVPSGLIAILLAGVTVVAGAAVGRRP